MHAQRGCFCSSAFTFVLLTLRTTTLAAGLCGIYIDGDDSSLQQCVLVLGGNMFGDGCLVADTCVSKAPILLRPFLVCRLAGGPCTTWFLF